MLSRLGTEDGRGAAVRIVDAAFPQPFPFKLEFNAPVHETWNIVHIGMHVPESHQIYICADNCMRGVVMTAAEMGALDRFSCVVLTEKDFLDGRLEEITLEGVTDVLHKLPKLPRAALIFPVCTHHFLGTDMRYIYGELEKRFPQVDFMRCWMDPIVQKHGISPDMKERRAVYEKIPKLETDDHIWLDVGSNMPLDPGSDLAQAAVKANTRIRSIAACENYEAFRRLGHAGAVITRSPSQLYGAKPLAGRLQVSCTLLAPEVTYEKIRDGRKIAAALFGKPEEDLFAAGNEVEEALCEEAFKQAYEVIGKCPIELDSVGLVRPIGFARILTAHGFHVRRIWLDAVHPDEEDDFRYLQQIQPDLELGCPTDVRMRTMQGKLDGQDGGEKTLAVGPKAAYMAQTAHFVNLLEQGGSWGYSGLRQLLDRMVHSMTEEKDLRQIVPRKGLGCRCVMPYVTTPRQRTGL